jgi:hypothetical protein
MLTKSWRINLGMGEVIQMGLGFLADLPVGRVKYLALRGQVPFQGQRKGWRTRLIPRLLIHWLASIANFLARR